VSAYPEFAAAWYYLGKSYLALNQPDRARESYERSITADAEYLLPCLGLAELNLQQGRFDDASAWSGRVLERNSQVTLAWYIFGYARFFLGDLEQAKDAVEKVRTSRDSAAYPGTHHLSGAILAAEGDMPGAAVEFRRFLALNPSHPGSDQLRMQLAEWERQGLIPSETR
jgi:tetratricopeptide (TPR) repeat protein